MTDRHPSTVTWGDDAADLATVVASQRDTIARLQSERDEDHETIARLQSQLSAYLRRPLD